MLAPAPANKVVAPVILLYSPNDLTFNVLAVGLPSVSKLPVCTLLVICLMTSDISVLLYVVYVCFVLCFSRSFSVLF